MITRTRAVVLAVAGLALAACSNVHPGAAAVVDGTTISMKTLDDAAEVYCIDQLLNAQQQGITAVSNADVRRQAVLGLVSLQVARDLARQDDLTIAAGSYRVPDGDRAAIAKAFKGVDVDTAVEVIEHSRETSAIAVALGAKASGQVPSEQNQAALAEAGQQQIAAAFADRDVHFAPRFALSPSGSARSDGTGSISVAPIDFEAPAAEELPAGQRCS